MPYDIVCTVCILYSYPVPGAMPYDRICTGDRPGASDYRRGGTCEAGEGGGQQRCTELRHCRHRERSAGPEQCEGTALCYVRCCTLCYVLCYILCYALTAVHRRA
jgi:hypothetical protein